jgi:DNA-directed RNA polymerase specialized sigma24 family protein
MFGLIYPLEGFELFGTRRVIHKLDPKSRIIVTLRDVEKFTIEETAKLLGLTIPAVGRDSHALDSSCARN